MHEHPWGNVPSICKGSPGPHHGHDLVKCFTRSKRSSEGRLKVQAEMSYDCLNPEQQGIVDALMEANALPGDEKFKFGSDGKPRNYSLALAKSQGCEERTMKQRLNYIYRAYGITGTETFHPMIRLAYLRAKELSLLGACLFVSVLAIAQAKPTAPQKGAATGQSKVAGKNLKATPKQMLNGAVVPAITGHSVNITCTASTSPGVTGYNFYSGATSALVAALPANATPLNNTPTSTCVWIDGTVIGTNTYFYAARAFCPTCSPQLSVNSNILGPEVIPPDAAPNPPSGLILNGPITQNGVPLQWNIPVPQAGYDILATEIFRGTSPTLPNPPRIATLPSWTHTYTDAAGCGASNSVCYYEAKNYSLFQNNGFVLSAPSNIVKVQMP